MRRFRAGLIAVLSSSLALAFSQSPSASLANAKRLYDEGRFAQALARLQTLVLTLEGEPSPDASSVREEAHFYMGLTYVALDDPEAAREEFRAVLRVSPRRQLDSDVHAPKVLEVFEAARKDVAQERTGERPPSPAPPTSVPVAAPKGPSRAKWLVAGAASGAGAAIGVHALTSDTEPAAAAPEPDIEVDYRVNGVKQGSFSCAQGLAFTIDVINRTTQLLRVNTFFITMNSLTSECLTHSVAVDGTVNVDLLPGARLQVRRLDLAGDVCYETPGRRPGCSWRSVVTVTTSLESVADEVQFSTVP